MSAHVPAWKRLGLKLKGPVSGEATTSSTGFNAPRASPAAQAPNAGQTRVNGSPASAVKRKLPSSASAPNAASSQTPNKKPRREDQSAAGQGTPSSLRKSVSFAEGTKDNTKDKAEKKKKKKKKAKKKKAKKTTDAPKADTNLEPSLHYLRQWHTARDSWKFNKNHQTLLIKYVFNGDKVPSSDIAIFYDYIRDLKGFVRTRLRETAAEIKQKDMEAGAGAFPATLKDKETKQKEYEETISRFLQDLQQQQQQQQKAKGSGKNANGKRTLDEVNYVLRTATPEVKQRLVKRIRAELVADVLSESEESTTSRATASTATTSTSSSSSASGREAVAVADGTAGTRRGDGSQQPAKRRRLRNIRTDIGDDDDDSSSSSSSSSTNSSSSSSESESEESDSEESSSGSDESSEDEEMDMAPGGEAAESSSSSSSSSSESGSEADTESDEERDKCATQCCVGCHRGWQIPWNIAPNRAKRRLPPSS
ncbi:hypothetical protein MYCTH_114710 [Thermothelomyces thermophilus ATCC 42464]|uniref:WKF domain-containing protein n=1 Tax=Thermothelomyces thermophilus (strain ATCC 42464 / BCRC 31852 / DSM 1799) TaxID=573729 RepID=G2Q8Q4_THET4|nr:uncharacterized protein MYCTH_114710 [Thermothelomyces thermophilus ATCC 42464]AEO57103.1 hypothetical protein MYCTH_114710 [Thermothelomyces thermophilus ATCC 42464]